MALCHREIYLLCHREIYLPAEFYRPKSSKIKIFKKKIYILLLLNAYIFQLFIECGMEKFNVVSFRNGYYSLQKYILVTKFLLFF